MHMRSLARADAEHAHAEQRAREDRESARVDEQSAAAAGQPKPPSLTLWLAGWTDLVVAVEEIALLQRDLVGGEPEVRACARGSRLSQATDRERDGAARSKRRWPRARSLARRCDQRRGLEGLDESAFSPDSTPSESFTSSSTCAHRIVSIHACAQPIPSLPRRAGVIQE